MAKIEGVVWTIDVNTLLGLGFDVAIVETLVREFSSRVAARRGQAMIFNVDNSVIAGVAYKAGYQYLSGKVVGVEKGTVDLATKIPVSRILLKS